MGALIALSILLLATLIPLSGHAEIVSVSLDELLGTYVLPEGRSVQFDLGTKFSSVRGASITLSGSGTPGLFEQCDLFGTGGCRQFEMGASALVFIEREGTFFLWSYESFDFAETETTYTRVLGSNPVGLGILLDGKGGLVLTHSGFVSIPEEPIYTLEPWEFTISRFALAVDGVRFRGVDFEDVAVPPGTRTPPSPEISSGEFTFSSQDGGIRLGNGVFFADNKTTYLFPEPSAESETVFMKRSDGRSFSLVGFDLGEWEGTSLTEVLVRGRRSDGSEAERRIVLDGIFDGAGRLEDFETIRMDPSWVQLEQVSFTGQPGDLGGGLVAIDELVASPAEDVDEDGSDEAFDNCPGIHNPDQTDTDGDSVGDACNDLEDSDADEWASRLDNCPFAANTDQGNSDSDFYGDACDLCPDYASPYNNDRDGNRIGDRCECGDQTEDGLVNVLDLVAINRAISGAAPPSPLCDANHDALCNVQDMVAVNLKIFGRPAYCSRYPPPVQ